MIHVEFTKQLESFLLDIHLELPLGSVLGLFGPSGCGKSMTLRILAGLVRPDKGYLKMGNVVLENTADGLHIPARKRKIGFLFQDYALFPHLTVEKNIAFGLNKYSSKEKKDKVYKVMERMRLKGMEKRFPQQLSGGQQQRVALARTLVTDPTLLLLDEPFSALDSQVKKRLEKEVLNIRDAFAGTIILVTHSFEEAYRLCSHIAIMESGKIIQLGSREEILRHPQTRLVARLTGMENIFDGLVRKRDGKQAVIWVEELGCHLTIPNVMAENSVSVGIRPSLITVLPGDASTQEEEENVFYGKVIQNIPSPDGQTLLIKLLRGEAWAAAKDYDIHAHLQMKSDAIVYPGFRPGELCQVCLPVASISVRANG